MKENQNILFRLEVFSAVRVFHLSYLDIAEFHENLEFTFNNILYANADTRDNH